MAWPREHRPQIVYVARSARQLPEPVRAWLDETGAQVTCSPDIYAAMAMLASGLRPEALIVDAREVDFSELSFFESAGRVCRGALICVVGPPACQEKMELAFERGACPFDADRLDRQIELSAARMHRPGAEQLVAGRLRQAPPQKPRDTGAGKDPMSASHPPVRLVRQGPADDDEVPVSVPWAPHPRRPQRTPPTRPEAGASPAQAGQHPLTPAPDQSKVAGSPMVSAEELAALLGKPPSPSPGSAREQSS